MYTKTVTIINKSGLHARPASDFVVAAKKFTSKITIRKNPDGASVNAKSIVMLLGEGLSKGTIIDLSADGADETEAVDSLARFIEEGCGEE